MTLETLVSQRGKGQLEAASHNVTHGQCAGVYEGADEPQDSLTAPHAHSRDTQGVHVVVSSTGVT